MATRSLTDIFVLMRTNAIRNRQIYPEQDTSERMQLVSLNDVEEGLYTSNENRMPPTWIGELERAQKLFLKLTEKINHLKTLQTKHLHRPTFDDTKADEEAIEECTNDISRLFNEGHRIIQVIKSNSNEGPIKEQRLTLSVYKAIALTLQELSQTFKAAQNGYLREMQSREDRSKVYFENQTPVFYDDEATEDIDDFFVRSNRITQQQLLYLEEENTKYAMKREQEVNAIVKSIMDVNKIFKDLSVMIADQGTVLDRIDYNIEKTHIDVFEGFKQLKKADAYQRRSRKMCAILILAVTTITLFFVLILVKT